MGGVLRAQNQDGDQGDLSPGGVRRQVYADIGGVPYEYGFLDGGGLVGGWHVLALKIL